MNYTEFALIIKEKRIERRITQKKMAKKLSISPSKYNKIENGSSEPSFIELLLICNILDIDFSFIIKQNENRKN